ncbi:MAG: glutamyl-tRNA reductase [Chloroflexi bacterium]|nr:glutamyl-tRNA reductase [Chloroflexota bacterium]
MRITLIGLNHKSAPLEVREQVSFSKSQLEEALPMLKDRVGESIILSTCNRSEFYAVGENPARIAEQVRLFIADYHGISVETISAHLYEYTDADAVRHLLRVASGLDSMIIGESQILGQVRDSLSAASDAQSVQTSLLGLFHAAVRTGRRVRDETDVGRNALSVSYAGVQLAQRTLGTLSGRRALLIGAGEAGQLVAKALRTVGIADLMIANRTLARAEDLTQSLGGRAIPFSEIESALGEADIVISATDSPEFVITTEMASSAVDGRREAPLFLFDLAVPRDVDPQVADLPGLRLFNIDDLFSIAEENLQERKRAAVDAEAIVEDELVRFMAWWDSLDAVPIIKTLRQHAEELRIRELERALRKVPNLSDEQREVMDALTTSIVNKLLHDPIASLKQQTDKSQLQAARDLFRLWDDSPEG